MDGVLFYQPHSVKGSPFPHSKLLPASKFRTSSLSNPISRQSSKAGRNKPIDGVSQFRGNDNVGGNKSDDDEPPSLQTLLSPITQARRSNLKTVIPQTASRIPPGSHSPKPSVQTADGSTSSPSDTTPVLRKSFFKNVPAWSFLNSSPAQTSPPIYPAKANDDTVHSPGQYTLARPNGPAVLSHSVPSGRESGSSVELDLVSSSADDCRTGRGNSQEHPLVIDDEDDYLTGRSSHISCQMILDDPGLGCENRNMDAGGAHGKEVVATSDLDDAATSQRDNHSTVIATLASFSPEIPESDNGVTLDGKGRLHSPLPGDSIISPPGERNRSPSPSGLNPTDGGDSEWTFDVFAENDSGTEGDGSRSPKRARSSPPPPEAAPNRPPLAVKGVQVSGSAHGDRPPRGGQGCQVRQVVGESGSEYEVTVITKMWLPKASVDPKLVRKYRAEQRTATRVRTRWSSRLQNRR